MKKETLKKLSKPLILPLAIGIVLWEELAYKPIKAITGYLEKNKIVHRVSDKIRQANPYVALAILVGGALPLLPFKMAGLYLIGHGYKALGIGTFALAKVIGGGIGVHLFNLTEPAIRKIPLVNSTLNWVFDKKDKIKHVLTESPAYIATKEMIHSAKSSIKEFIANNEVIQKAKNLFKKKTTSTHSESSHVIVETSTSRVIESANSTIFERITTKVDIMSDSVSNFVEKPQPQVVEIDKTSSFSKIGQTTVKPIEENKNKLKP